MNDKILFVDDEQHVLASYRRTLRKGWDVVTALGGETALEVLDSKGPFAVIVTDMRMPGMNGVQLLAKVKEKSPDTVRMMLTGFAEFNTAMEAVNEGNIFRFLTKPCPPELLTKALEEAVNQYRLIKAEHELLNKTLKGSIKVLIEILSMVDQQSFSKATKLRDYIRRLTNEKVISLGWEIEIAALLSQVGQVTIPEDVNEKIRKKHPLLEVEKKMIERIPKSGHDLISKIPRLKKVAEIILYQNKHFDGKGFPDKTMAGIDLPVGSRLLRILNDLIALEANGKLRNEAFDIMINKAGVYDPNLLKSVVNNLGQQTVEQQAIKQEILFITLAELEVGDTLMDNIETTGGQTLMMAGTEMSESNIMRINNVAKLHEIKEPFKILKISF